MAQCYAACVVERQGGNWPLQCGQPPVTRAECIDFCTEAVALSLPRCRDEAWAVWLCYFEGHYTCDEQYNVPVEISGRCPALDAALGHCVLSP